MASPEVKLCGKYLVVEDLDFLNTAYPWPLQKLA